MKNWRRSCVVKSLLVATIGVVGATEMLDYLVRKQSSTAGISESCALVVLGLPGNSTVTRAVQRWRVSMAVRARRRYSCGTIVFTGGTPYSEVAEATQMSAIAQRRGIDDKVILVENRSTSTRDNVRNASELLRDRRPEITAVIIVSDALHARRAKRYWSEENPHESRRVTIDAGYRFLDSFWLKVPITAHELFFR